VGTLEIQIEQQGGRVVVRLLGEFDISGIRDFQRAVSTAEDGAQMVCIDLRGLSFMGASGLRCLLDVQARSRRDGFSLVVVKGPPLVQRVFEMTGVNQRLVMLDDPAEGNGKDPAV
jgi:anti-sigma B factor antagonist